jgi:hypothetical protein
MPVNLGVIRPTDLSHTIDLEFEKQCLRCRQRYMTAQIEIPDPESSTAREVFVFFGLATYAAQVLEAEAINLCVALEASRKQRVYRDKVEALFRNYEMRTFGTLLKALRNDSRIPGELRTKYETAAVDRNRLAHSFFRDHSEYFLSDVGRREMIDELRQMAFNFRAVDAASESMTHSIWEKLGITNAVLTTEFEAMQARARLRDAAT